MFDMNKKVVLIVLVICNEGGLSILDMCCEVEDYIVFYSFEVVYVFIC